MSRIAVVGAETLLGKETAERCSTLDPDPLLRTLEEAAVGRLSEVGGGAGLITRVDFDELATVDLVFDCSLASGPSRPLRERLAIQAPYVWWLAANSDEPSAGLTLATDLLPMPGPRGGAAGTALRCPHPAVIACTEVLRPLVPLGLAHVVANVLQPVSLFGQEAVEEVFGEMRDLVSFKPVRARRFGQQLVFNVLPAAATGEAELGDDATSLAGVPVSVHCLQAGVLHALVATFHLRFAAPPTVDTLRDALESGARLAFAEEPERLSPVSVAGQNTVWLGRLQPDVAEPCAVWLDAVMDNLTVTAEYLIRAAAALLDRSSH